mgnify:CR=1 FL=1
MSELESGSLVVHLAPRLRFSLQGAPWAYVPLGFEIVFGQRRGRWGAAVAFFSKILESERSREVGMQTKKEDVPMEQAGNGEAQDGQEAAVGGAEENIKSPYLTLEGIKGRQATIGTKKAAAFVDIPVRAFRVAAPPKMSIALQSLPFDFEHQVL